MGEKWMEEVAQAGGFEEHGKLKAQQELVEKMNKMPLEKFFQLAYMLNTLERMFDKGASDLGFLTGITDTIKDTITTELKAATSELMNSINTSINTLLEPLLPAITVIINTAAHGIALGFQGWVSLFTGKWADFERKLEEMFPGITQWREDFRVELTEYWQQVMMMLNPSYRDQILAANISGTAGGVYSGQFDLDPDALAAMLENLQIPTFEEE